MHESGERWAAPTGSPIGTSGWYLASDGEWYRSTVPPAVGHVLFPDGRWYPPDGTVDAWRRSRWGLGDVWWGVLAYVVAGLVGVFAVWAVSGGDPTDEEGAFALATFVALNAVAIFGVLWHATRRKGLGSLGDDFGLRARWMDPLVGFGIGVGGVFAAALAVFAVDSALDADERTSNVPVDELTTFGQFALFFVAVAIITPVVEELFFRGLVYRSLLKRGRSTWRAMATTTVIFVIPHLPAAETWKEVVGLFASIGVLGLAFNLACHWRGNRLAAPIVAHMFVNGLATVALYVG